jgi:D-arabinose 1-dehydrogenase-like Zn-dependent alcohol dehydrogenase
VLAEHAAAFDVVVDVVGLSDSMSQALRLVRPGGRVVAVGYSAGSSFMLDSPPFVLKELEVAGSRGFNLDELERSVALVTGGRVQMVIGQVTPFEAAFDAYSALASGAVVGRAVIAVS